MSWWTPMMSPGPIREKSFASIAVVLTETPIGTEARSFGGKTAPGLPSASGSLICVAMPFRTHDWNWYFATSTVITFPSARELEVRDHLDLSGKRRVAAHELLMMLVGLGLRRKPPRALAGLRVGCQIRDCGDGELFAFEDDRRR